MADSGEPRRQFYVIRWGAQVETATSGDLSDEKFWGRFDEAQGIGSKYVRDLLRNIVIQQGRDAPKVNVYERGGWYTIDGRRYCVFEDGRTVPEGPRVRVILQPDEAVEVVKAPEAWASQAEMRAALETMAKHGWMPLAGVGIGLRSLVRSLCDIRLAVMPVAEPNAGKDCTGWAMQLPRCDPGWPPHSVATFGSTAASIEKALDRARDQVAMVADLSIPRNATAKVDQEFGAKLDAIGRPMFNDDPIKQRCRRDMGDQRMYRVTGTPVAPAQRMPDSVQESLIRRFCVLNFDRNPLHADVKWYGQKNPATGECDNANALILPVRSIGQAFLERMAAAEDPGGEIARNDADAVRILAPYVEKEVPGWADLDNGFDEVVRATASWIGGLAFAADAAGMPDRWAQFRAIAPDVCVSLRRQAEEMRNRAEAADNLGVASAEVIRKSFTDRRGHVRNHSTPMHLTSGCWCRKDASEHDASIQLEDPPQANEQARDRNQPVIPGKPWPAVPGLTEQEQGLAEVPGRLAMTAATPPAVVSRFSGCRRGHFPASLRRRVTG